MYPKIALIVLLAGVCAGAAGKNTETAAASSGTSAEKGLLREWPKEGPTVLWRIPVGVGSNYPSVAGNDLCYAESDLSDAFTETVRCVDANSGKEKWSHTYKVFPRWWVGWGDIGVRATPTITDRYVYSIGTFGHGFCFERQTGKVVWQHDFYEENTYLAGMGTPKRLSNLGNLEWKGFNGGLVPVGDKIPYFMWQGGNPAIGAWQKVDITSKMQFYAYDAKTGKVAWKFEEDCKPGTGGPGLITGGALPIKFRNEDCFVFRGNGEWKILRQADGKQVWKWDNPGGWASGGLDPVGKNLYMGQSNGQLALFECDFSANDPKPKLLWSDCFVSEAVTGYVVVNGYIYGFTVDRDGEKGKYAQDPGNHPGEINFSLRCSDLMTGKMLWKQPGFKYGLAMLVVDGMLYIHDYQKLTLVEANPKSYVEKGRVEKLHTLSNVRNNVGLLDWCRPVISEGRLFIRTPVELISYDIKDRNAK